MAKKDVSWETICAWFGIDPALAAACKPDPRESQARLRSMQRDAATLEHVPAQSLRPMEADTPVIVESE